LAKLHGNIFSVSENIAKKVIGATFLTHPVIMTEACRRQHKATLL